MVFTLPTFKVLWILKPWLELYQLSPSSLLIQFWLILSSNLWSEIHNPSTFSRSSNIEILFLSKLSRLLNDFISPLTVESSFLFWFEEQSSFVRILLDIIEDTYWWWANRDCRISIYFWWSKFFFIYDWSVNLILNQNSYFVV